jgi:natural product biosynthesis luciferase-like monooxygenase protein
MDSFSVVVIGGESLLIACSEQVLARGHRILALVSEDPRIVAWATSRGIPTEKPGGALAERLPAEFDFLLSIANLRMIPDALVQRARRGAINFHDGPLPRYAGLNAPVWALIAGEAEHGVSWHVMQGGPDEGNLLVQREFAIEPSDTALTLNARCYEYGVDSFAELLAKMEASDLAGTPQDLSQRSYFAKHQRPAGLGLIDFATPGEEIERLVRALHFGTYRNPVALAKLSVGGKVFYPTHAAVDEAAGEAGAGTVLAVDADKLIVATSSVPVALSHFVRSDRSSVPADVVARELGLITGQRVPPAEGLAAELDRLGERCKNEDAWALRLRRAEGIDAPLAIAAQSSESGRLALDTLGAGSAELLAAFVAWLGRLASKERITLGAVDHAFDLGPHSALFARQVPLELELPDGLTFAALTSAARAELERIAKHASYPEDLIARTPELGRPSYAVGVELGAGAEVERLGRVLTLALSGNGAALVYDPAAYSAVAIGDVAAQLTSLLAAGRAAPDTAVGKLPLLGAEARRVLLEDFNATERALAGPRLVHEVFEAQVARTPDAVALVFEGRTLRYGELNERANRLARRLVQSGVGNESLVGIYLKRSEQLVIAVLATLKAGAAYVPLDPGYPADRVAFMLSDSRARLVISDSSLASSVPAGVDALVVDSDAELAAQGASNLGTPLEPSHRAYVIYTSGSTGKPKGVMVEHGNAVNFFAGMDERVPHEAGSVWLAVTSLSFDISVLELLWTLGRGFKVVVAADDRVEVSRAPLAGGLDLEFSLFYFASDEGGVGRDKYKLLLEGAKFADEHDFSAVWTPERHFAAFGGLYPNPSVASAAIAAITKRVKIRAGSCVLPLHHPARVAEEWSLVDNLSNGRVGISFAAGWHPNDFLLRPESFADNKNVMIRDIDVVRRLWRGETLTFQGPKGPVPIQTLPRPVQAELPIWLTAAGNVQTFEAAAKVGAGVLTHLLGQSLEELREKVDAYRRVWREKGLPGNGHVTLMVHTFVGEDDEEVKRLVREPMKAYLKSSISLIAAHAWSFPAFKRVAKEGASFNDNFLSLSSEDMDALLEYSFDRYYETAGLFGSPARCLETLRTIQACGADEVACLIDFGVDSEAVLEQLPRLDEVRRLAGARPEPAADDYSLAAQIQRHQVTHLQCTPSMARMLLTNEGSRAALRRIQYWMIGGEALPPSLLADMRRATGASILNMYGPTETTVWSSTDVVGDEVTLGRPIANTSLYVLDKQQEPLPIGAPGELYIGGLGVTRGYLGRPELTRERFVPDPFSKRPGARMYRTGDLVRFRRDGRLDFLGRLDHQVKVRGYRIELGEIESALARAPGVREAVVIAREDTPGDVRLVGYFLASGDRPPQPSELRQHVAASLPEYMVPAHFVRLEAFPLTPNAKVDRKALPPPGSVVQAEAKEFVRPDDETEDTISRVYKELLGVERVGATDNFFELGGHSLLAVRAHRELRQALSVELSITDIFRFPTPRGLREHLTSKAEGGDKPGAHVARVAARRDAMARRDALRRARKN